MLEDNLFVGLSPCFDFLLILAFLASYYCMTLTNFESMLASSNIIRSSDSPVTNLNSSRLNLNSKSFIFCSFSSSLILSFPLSNYSFSLFISSFNSDSLHINISYSVMHLSSPNFNFTLSVFFCIFAYSSLIFSYTLSFTII